MFLNKPTFQSLWLLTESYLGNKAVQPLAKDTLLLLCRLALTTTAKQRYTALYDT